MLNLFTKPYIPTDNIIENNVINYIENNLINYDEMPLDTEKQLRREYGDWFCDQVGIDNLLKMPRVTPESLKLTHGGAYNPRTVLIEYLQGNAAVKGIDKGGRAFVAFVTIVSDKSEKLQYQCAELLHKRYAYGMDNNYVSALWNMCDDGIERRSLFSDGSNYDFSRLKDFFDGNKIKTSLMEKEYSDMRENSIERQPEETEERLRQEFGDWFCNTAGVDNLKKMPRVKAESLKINNENECRRNIVLIEYLKEHSAVKGVDGSGYPFIAVRTQHFDDKKKELFKCVELIYNRSAFVKKDDYVSAVDNLCDDGKSRPSVFYLDESKQDFSRLKNFLDGERLRTSLMKTGFIENF